MTFDIQQSQVLQLSTESQVALLFRAAAKHPMLATSVWAATNTTANDSLHTVIERMSPQERTRLLTIGGQSYPEVATSILMADNKHSNTALRPSLRQHPSPNVPRSAPSPKSPGRIRPLTLNKPPSPARSPLKQQTAQSPVRAPNVKSNRTPVKGPPLRFIVERSPIKAIGPPSLAGRLDASLLDLIFGHLYGATSSPPTSDILSLCLVSKSWKQASQKLLHKDVALTSPRKIQQYLVYNRTSPIMQYCRYLYIVETNGFSFDDPNLCALLKIAKSLRYLKITTMESRNHSPFLSPFTVAFSHLVNLHSFCISAARLTYIPSLSSALRFLPALRTLRLNNVFLNGSSAIGAPPPFVLYALYMNFSGNLELNAYTTQFLLSHAPLSLRKLTITNLIDESTADQVKEIIRNFGSGLSHLEIAGWLECSSKLSPIPLCSCPQLNTFIVHQLRIGCMIHPSASLKTLKVNLYGFDASVTDLPANEKEETVLQWVPYVAPKLRYLRLAIIEEGKGEQVIKDGPVDYSLM